MEQIIRKAIEGGWKWMSEGYDLTQFVGDKYEGPTDAEIREDPLFWQALGKALGWNKMIGENSCELCGEPMTEEDGQMFKYHGYARNCPKPPLENKDWKKEWHRFIDHLIEGKSADEFFNSLIPQTNG